MQSKWFHLTRRLAATACVAATVVCSVAHAGGPSDRPVRTAPAATAVADRYIVKFRDGANAQAAQAALSPAARVAALGARTGRTFQYVRAMSGGAHVVRLTADTTGFAAASAAAGRTAAQTSRLVAAQLMSDPDVQYVDPDARMVPLLVPNDPLYSGSQWDLYEAAGGIDVQPAWDVTTGSSAITIAVIDTGYRPHADLSGRFVQGYDFITDTTISNDGDGRDADASDPGDWCGSDGSSWHGTHVSGTIGAIGNNGTGIAGINWVSKILPARVLGQCGGYTSDIIDAVRWSAGIAVTGVPANANPARVENLSLGGNESCTNAFQSAINDVVARGTVVVVAAGNSNTDVATSEPANCAGVVAVAATTRSGGRASFSNYGTGITISAPGTGIVSTVDAGRTTPTGDSYASYQGTSMAAPHVTGVVSLMLSQNPSLTPAQVIAKLKSSARAFPTGTGSDCNTATCGAGIVDAYAALGGVTSLPTRTNVAASANGAVASASSVYGSGWSAAGVNNGDRAGLNWGAGGGWNDGTVNAYPDWVRIDFPRAQAVSEIDVFTLQDDYNHPVTPTESMTFTQYGITAFDVQYWNGSAWVTVPNGSVANNNKVWTKFAFPAVTTTAIRVQVNNAGNAFSRIVEIEAYADAPPVNVALSANGGVAAASSVYGDGWSAAGVTNGDRRGLNWGSGGGWNDGTVNSYPDTIQVNFNATKSINEIDVFTLQDDYNHPSEPTPTMTFTQYGITDFDVQYWNGSTWVTVPGGTVAGNNLVWRKFEFSPLSTNAIRINVRNAGNSFSRVTEIEAYTAP